MQKKKQWLKQIMKEYLGTNRQISELNGLMHVTGGKCEEALSMDKSGAFLDDVKGGALDPEGVAQARAEEMSYVKKIGVYRSVTREEAMRAGGGKAPIKVRWIDLDNGERYRSRLVAKEYRHKDKNTWFAAIPPLESLRVLCRWLENKSAQRRQNKASPSWT